MFLPYFEPLSREERAGASFLFMTPSLVFEKLEKGTEALQDGILLSRFTIYPTVSEVLPLGLLTT